MHENYANPREQNVEVHTHARAGDARDTLDGGIQPQSTFPTIAELCKELGVLPLQNWNPFVTVDTRHDFKDVLEYQNKEATMPSQLQNLKLRHLLVPDDGADAKLAASYRRAENLIINSSAPLTNKKYDNLWQRVLKMCKARGLQSLPMSTQTAAYLIADMLDEGLAVTYVACLVGVIAMAHRYAGYPNPTDSTLITAVMKGARRRYGRPPVGKNPLLIDDLRRIAPLMRNRENTVQGVRDLAIVTLGFAAALRRSELVGIELEHLNWSEDETRLTILIPRSKTDRIRAGQRVVVDYSGSQLCPVTNVKHWMRLLPESSGPLFRRVSTRGKIFGGRMDPGSIARILKGYVASAGLAPEKYAGHSMRAGFVTEALAADGVREIDVMRQARHTDPSTTIGYYRPPAPPNLTRALDL